MFETKPKNWTVSISNHEVTMTCEHYEYVENELRELKEQIWELQKIVDTRESLWKKALDHFA